MACEWKETRRMHACLNSLAQSSGYVLVRKERMQCNPHKLLQQQVGHVHTRVFRGAYRCSPFTSSTFPPDVWIPI
eukprot:114417-Pelagomonas_calceolata.AAC.2